jgi:hypothetical protein
VNSFPAAHCGISEAKEADVRRNLVQDLKVRNSGHAFDREPFAAQFTHFQGPLALTD